MSEQAAEQDQPVHTNQVRLVGRLSVTPEERKLPSGDRVLTFRLVVERGPEGRRRPSGVSGPSVDTLSCAAWRGDLRRVVRSWRAGDLVEVEGALRRRFWQGASGAANRYEVEVRTTRRLVRSEG